MVLIHKFCVPALGPGFAGTAEFPAPDRAGWPVPAETGSMVSLYDSPLESDSPQERKVATQTYLFSEESKPRAYVSNQ